MGLKIPNLYLRVVETLPEQDDLRDETRVRNDHGDGPEHTLQVVRELGSSRVTRVHSDEYTTRPNL